MSKIYRKVKPKLKLGAEGKRERQKRSRKYENIEKGLLIIEKEEAGYGYKHLLNKEDIFELIEMIPEWEIISNGLKIITLARGKVDSDGWYSVGKIAICAWEKDLWKEVSSTYFNEHKPIFDKLAITYEKKKGKYTLHFTENQAKTFQLLHVFLHELGHHFDRINNSSRSELFAEQYAFDYLSELWDTYIQKFPVY